MSSRLRRSAAAVAAAGIALSVAIAANPANAERSSSSSLADVRRATARYHQVSVALEEGFVAAADCTAHPQLGGMGLHYVHPARLADPRVDANEPEILLYEPLPGGRLRLVGVEWFAVDPDQNLETDDGRPELFGVPFDGPMPGHGPGMPVHFDLHAWTWKHNPAGMFAPWNPKVTCTP